MCVYLLIVSLQTFTRKVTASQAAKERMSTNETIPGQIPIPSFSAGVLLTASSNKNRYKLHRGFATSRVKAYTQSVCFCIVKPQQLQEKVEKQREPTSYF